MIVAFIALATALVSTVIALSGVRMVIRDTVEAVGTLIGDGPARAPALAFGLLWILIFCLALS